MEPQCITCDIDSLLWSSRRLYTNCTYFDAFLSPPSSIATDYRIEHYVLECQGPTLPVAGKTSTKNSNKKISNDSLIYYFKFQSTSLHIHKKMIDYYNNYKNFNL